MRIPVQERPFPPIIFCSSLAGKLNTAYGIPAIELLPGCEHISPPHQQNVIEHILVAEGAMEVYLNSAWKY